MGSIRSMTALRPRRHTHTPDWAEMSLEHCGYEAGEYVYGYRVWCTCEASWIVRYFRRDEAWPSIARNKPLFG